MQKLICPCCKGKGELKKPRNYFKKGVDWTSVMKLLRKEGYSFSEICQITGHKSKRSVSIYINRPR